MNKDGPIEGRDLLGSDVFLRYILQENHNLSIEKIASEIREYLWIKCLALK